MKGELCVVLAGWEMWVGFGIRWILALVIVECDRGWLGGKLRVGDWAWIGFYFIWESLEQVKIGKDEEI